MRILFVDACPRTESRSRRLAEAFLETFAGVHPEAEPETLRLETMGLRPLTEATLQARTARIDAGDLSDPMFDAARAFQRADCIVVAAPYWDFMFPAALKTLIEHVCVRTLTFVYVDDRPVGLCRARNLIYLTTAGGFLGEDNWGGAYLNAVCSKLLGTGAFHQVSAEGLDVTGADPEAILAEACQRARALARSL